MNINYNGSKVLSTILFGTKIVNIDYKDVERAVDTFTYLYEIKGGFEKETYEDEPYLIPYVCEGSDAAVIIIPGGAFGYKSVDGTTGEGKDIALALNENGISAFVLHYRSNPYEYPISYLDVQRAVRYLRFHCEDYQTFAFDRHIFVASQSPPRLVTFCQKTRVHDEMHLFTKNAMDHPFKITHCVFLRYSADPPTPSGCPQSAVR